MGKQRCCNNEREKKEEEEQRRRRSTHGRPCVAAYSWPVPWEGGRSNFAQGSEIILFWGLGPQASGLGEGPDGQFPEEIEIFELASALTWATIQPSRNILIEGFRGPGNVHRASNTPGRVFGKDSRCLPPGGRPQGDEQQVDSGFIPDRTPDLGAQVTRSGVPCTRHDGGDNLRLL